MHMSDVGSDEQIHGLLLDYVRFEHSVEPISTSYDNITL